VQEYFHSKKLLISMLMKLTLAAEERFFFTEMVVAGSGAALNNVTHFGVRKHLVCVVTSVKILSQT